MVEESIRDMFHNLFLRNLLQKPNLGLDWDCLFPKVLLNHMVEKYGLIITRMEEVQPYHLVYH